MASASRYFAVDGTFKAAWNGRCTPCRSTGRQFLIARSTLSVRPRRCRRRYRCAGTGRAGPARRPSRARRRMVVTACSALICCSAAVGLTLREYAWSCAIRNGWYSAGEGAAGAPDLAPVIERSLMPRTTWSCMAIVTPSGAQSNWRSCSRLRSSKRRGFAAAHGCQNPDPWKSWNRNVRSGGSTATLRTRSGSTSNRCAPSNSLFTALPTDTPQFAVKIHYISMLACPEVIPPIFVQVDQQVRSSGLNGRTILSPTTGISSISARSRGVTDDLMDSDLLGERHVQRVRGHSGLLCFGQMSSLRSRHQPCSDSCDGVV